jgi:integrase/recombinase XerC
MNEYIDDFINYIRTIRNYSDYTETNYLLDLDNYEEFLKKYRLNFKKINYDNITKYNKYLKDELKLSASSISRHLSSLRSFYNYLLSEGIVDNNPFKLVSSPKKDIKLPNYMKYKEFEEMINTCDESLLGIRNRCLLEILFSTGARIGELINIKLKDINIHNKEIKVLGKGNKERIVYINDHTVNALNKYLNESRPILLNNKRSDNLFINHIGGNLTTRGVRDILDNIIKKSSLNIKVTPHMFRHTFATMLLNEGCDLKSVQELLGHVNMSTTQIYTHVSNNYIKEVYLHSHPRNKNTSK